MIWIFSTADQIINNLTKVQSSAPEGRVSDYAKLCICRKQLRTALPIVHIS